MKNHISTTVGFFIVFLFTVQGCYHYRVSVDIAPAEVPKKQTVHAIAWGLWESKPVDDIKESDCPSLRLHEVRVSTNYGYLLLSVLTLGFWVPMDVQWQCAVDPQPFGSNLQEELLKEKNHASE